MKYAALEHQRKLSTIFLCIIFYFFCIFSRLVYLQIIQHSKYSHSGQKNFLRFKTIPAQRGNILDCNGQPLATNKPVTGIVWKGTGQQKLTKQQHELLEKISSILEKETLPLGAIKRAEKFSTQTTIAENITQEQMFLIAEQCSDIPNITFTTIFDRFYPHDTFACHILGYLGDMNINTQGKMGLEKLFEDSLKGQPGLLLQSINSFGTLLETKEVKNQLSGSDIVTSIDLSLQAIAEKVMDQQEVGSFILLDPKTGHIKALVSKPNFSPTIFSKKISHEQWQEMQQQKAFINRAFNATYPPASIFKLITIIAAIEENIIQSTDTFTCKGYTPFKGRKYFCNNHYGHGKVTIQESLAHSCNIPFYEIAKRISIDKLAHYAFEFGLGNKTDLPFSEKFGLVPTNEWKILHKGERWWTGETLSACIGQSFLLVTPIQIACLIGGIFEGYMVKPTILHHFAIEKRPIEVNKETLEFIQDSMRSVITSGTGRRIKKLKDLTVFAKTGTAQTITRTNRDGKRESPKEHAHKEHAWFVSYFYKEEYEPYVMVIILENVEKSRYATKVGHQFLKQFLDLEKNQKEELSE